nr:hypothetical protein [Tanacetum cinerariifolium]
KWHPDENLLKEDVTIVPVWVKLYGVPVTTFSEDGLSAIATKLGTPLMLNSYISDMCMQSWGSSSYARVMIELRADVKLKDNIVVAMLKITREGHYTCNVRVEYEWKPPSLVNPLKVFRLVQKMTFKSQKEYRPVIKKPNTSSSGNKKKGVGTTIEVSNSNPFDVFNSVDNDVEFDTNKGTSSLGNNEATPSGSSFMYIDNDGEFASNTPIGIMESDSEVAVVYDEIANLMIPTNGNDRSDKSYELGIDLNIPLSEQDPLIKLNELANKKRKHANDIHDYFRANKRLKSSIQYKDHLAGTVLNKYVLGKIMFNSYHKQDFVIIEDLRDF